MQFNGHTVVPKITGQFVQATAVVRPAAGNAINFVGDERLTDRVRSVQVGQAAGRYRPAPVSRALESIGRRSRRLIVAATFRPTRWRLALKKYQSRYLVAGRCQDQCCKFLPPPLWPVLK